MPGHGDWEQGEPKIMVLDGPCKNTMNPTEPATYTFLAKFLKEVTTIFNDEYIFLGGDEVCFLFCFFLFFFFGGGRDSTPTFVF